MMYNIFQKYEISKKTATYKQILKKINEIDLSHLNSDELQEKINKQSTINNSEKDIISLFACIKESLNRKFGFKVHDEQVLGALALFYHNVIDMKTGEGKTIVAVFPAIANAKLGKKVHIVTANDYLAHRDYNTMRDIYSQYGVSLNFISENDRRVNKTGKYDVDVVYTTARSLCFDYLHDNLLKEKNKKILNALEVAIIDEIDFVLIEEARSPVSISGGTENSFESALLLQNNVELFNPNVEFKIDPKSKNVELNESGFKVLEDLLIRNELIKEKSDLYTPENTKFLQTLNQTLRANYTLKKDVDYIVRNGEIVIIDENTGRLNEGKTWVGGLHQAVEIKEQVNVHLESKTLATTSLQGFFSKYEKIVGMSGTAKNDEIEFKEIYDLDVIEIKTHREVIREDLEDILYFKQIYALENLLNDVIEKHNIGRPILIGTTSVKDSEKVYQSLLDKNIPCEILNAKNHEREATIIEGAGKFGHVTISTNMAGRGTDIMLGGNKDTEIAAFIENGLSFDEATLAWKEENRRINELGGLHVIGFARNTSRKIDDQLKGRSGRQGDRGSSRFYLSLEDDLLTVYGKSIEVLFNTLTMGVKTVGITDKRMSNHIKDSQKKNEHFLFNARKSVVKYSEISEKQANIIIEMRNKVLELEDFSNILKTSYIKTVDYIFEDIEDEFVEEKIEKFKKELQNYISLDNEFIQSLSNTDIEDIKTKVLSKIEEIYNDKRNLFEDDVKFEKDLILGVIDNSWTEHLTALDNMQKGTSFRIYAQKNPLEEFKNESYKMFNNLIRQIFIDITNAIVEFNPVDFIEKIADNSQNILPSNVNNNYTFLKANKYGY